MSDKTKIEWTDATWNPITGCTKVSPGCDHCYAESIAHRFAGTPSYPDGFGVTLRPERLGQPLRWTRPRRVFVNSMSDLFHQDIPDEYIARVFAVMALSPRHTFQVLTKRHGRMRSLLSSFEFAQAVYDAWTKVELPGKGDYPTLTDDAYPEWPLPNVWLGVSVEDQQRADLRIPALLDTPAAVRFLSCEPLLGPVDLARSLARWRPGDDQPWDGNQLHARDVLHWVIVGGESGRQARPMHPDWARRLLDDCTGHDIPFFFKQWGEYTPQHGKSDPWAWAEPTCWVNRDTGETADEATAVAAGGHWASMWRVGKSAAGNVLEGQTWYELPAGCVGQ